MHGLLLSLELLSLELLDSLLVHDNLSWIESDILYKVEIWVADKLSKKVQERFLKLIVGLGRHIIVLEVSLSVNGDLIGLDFSVLDIGLVSDQTNWNIWSNLDQVIEPLQDVLVGLSACKIEHDDGTLRANVVALSELSELFLASSVPDLNSDLSVSGIEYDLSNTSSLGWDVGLNEVTSMMSLDKGGLADSTVPDQNKLESWNVILLATLLIH